MLGFARRLLVYASGRMEDGWPKSCFGALYNMSLSPRNSKQLAMEAHSLIQWEAALTTRLSAWNKVERGSRDNIMATVTLPGLNNGSRRPSTTVRVEGALANDVVLKLRASLRSRSHELELAPARTLTCTLNTRTHSMYSICELEATN